MLKNIFFTCNAMVSSNIIPINVNFVTIHETGSSSPKIVKKFLGKEFPEAHLKYKLGLLISCNPFFSVAVVFHCT